MFSKKELELMLDAIKMIEANTDCKYLAYRSRVQSSITLIREQLEWAVHERVKSKE